MVANTVTQNQRMGLFEGHKEIWLFGYGSLIHHTDFPWLERKPALIHHWVRRFWQGSHDHRGTEDAPGRVVTLIAEPEAVCHGVAYRISPVVFAHLDHREKNGYLRQRVTIHFTADSMVEGLVYIAAEDNSAFLGPESVQLMAQQIAVCKGPSGSNQEYLTALANALRELQADDPHVFSIEQALQNLISETSGAS